MPSPSLLEVDLSAPAPLPGTRSDENRLWRWVDTVRRFDAKLRNNRKSSARFNPVEPELHHLTRSSLHRCLQRHGISRLPEVKSDKPDKKKFKAYPIGYFHIDIAEVYTAEGKLYLYVGIDRTRKFTFVQLVKTTGRTSASAFLVALIKAVPYKIHTVLTDKPRRVVRK